MQSEVIEKIDNTALKIFVIWLPVIPGDGREKALNSRAVVSDPRALHFWDGTRSLGKEYKDILKLQPEIEAAWDVYLAFGRLAEWNEKPPRPNEWMHQLSLMNNEKKLDGDKFRSIVEKLLQTGG